LLGSGGSLSSLFLGQDRNKEEYPVYFTCGGHYPRLGLWLWGRPELFFPENRPIDPPRRNLVRGSERGRKAWKGVGQAQQRSAWAEV
jgi:hypothetical protein